jgi:hypothetical protein
MRRFADQKLEQIYHTRFAPGLPKHIVITAHEVASLLTASRSLQDVGVIGPIDKPTNSVGVWRYISSRVGNWEITVNTVTHCRRKREDETKRLLELRLYDSIKQIV